MIDDKELYAKYEIVKNMALSNGISSSSIHYEDIDTESLHLVIECNNCLTLMFYYDCEWIIEYYYEGGSTHNHAPDCLEGYEYINLLLRGDIYILIDRRPHDEIGSREFRFVNYDELDQLRQRLNDTNRVKLFSAREIIIDS